MNSSHIAFILACMPLVMHALPQPAIVGTPQQPAPSEAPAAPAAPTPEQTISCKSTKRDFEAAVFKLAIPHQSSKELDFEITPNDSEPLLRSGMIVVRRFRPIIRGKEGGATSFGTTFGLASFDISEPVTTNNVTRDTVVHYELYMRRTPVELDERGQDKHLVFWFRKNTTDTGTDRSDLAKQWSWVLIRTVTGMSAEVSATGEYGTWTNVPESVQKAGAKLYAALNVGADE